MAHKKRAFSYIRMSTDVQLKGHSLARQTEYAEEYAKKNNLELVESLQDLGISAHSGANVEKGELGRFLKAIEDGEIEKDCVLLVENLDRLSRKTPMQAFRQFSDILDYGLEIHTISDNQVYTSETLEQNQGLLFMSMGGMLKAFKESDDKSKRLSKAWEAKRDNAKNKNLTSICPKWMKAKKDKNGYNLIPERAKAIKKLFSLCIDENLGMYSITKTMNTDEDYPPFSNKKGAMWIQSYITKILHNKSVYGEFQPMTGKGKERKSIGKPISNYYPSVVSKDRYILAQLAIKERSVGGRGAGQTGVFKNTFHNLLTCGYCGRGVHYVDKGKPPKGGQYLKCYASTSGGTCDAPNWRYNNFDSSFYTFIKDVPLDLVLRKGNSKTRKNKLQDKQYIANEKIKSIEDKIDVVYELNDGLDDRAIKRSQKAVRKYNEELNTLEDNLDDIQSEIVQIDNLDNTNQQDKIVRLIKKKMIEGDAEQGTILRKRINKQLKSVIQKIEIFSHPRQPSNPSDIANFSKQFPIDKSNPLKPITAPVPVNTEMPFFIVHFKSGVIHHVTPHPYEPELLLKSIEYNENEFDDEMKVKMREQATKSVFKK